MATDANIFGLSGTGDMAKSVMAGLERQSAPSPHNPVQVPNDQASLNYQRLYDSCSKLLKLETDPARLFQLHKTRQFVDEVLAADSDAMPAELVTPAPPPPAAMPAPPPAVAAPPPQGGPGGPPGPPMGGPPPGLPMPGGQ